MCDLHVLDGLTGKKPSKTAIEMEDLDILYFL
jgi:hypothetical protein